MTEVAAPRNWKQFLLRGMNKAGLEKCYTKHMIAKASTLLGDQFLFISGGQDRKVVKITNHSVAEIPDLFSNQEEADTRIIIHTLTAAKNGSNRIVIYSADKYVLVVLLYHQEAIPARETYFLTGREGRHANLMRYTYQFMNYSINSTEQHNIMLAAYCLTGCDTTSSFLGHALPYQDYVDGICTNPLALPALYHHGSDSDME